MAHASLFHSRKLVRLTMRISRLGVCTMPELAEALAVGLLEKLWDWSYREESPELGTAEEIEYKLSWRGETGELVSAIAEAGFLDRRGDAYSLHDWEDWIPEAVKKRVRRKADKSAADNVDRTADSVRQTAPNGGQRPDNVRQTAPNGAKRPPPGGQCLPTEAELKLQLIPPPCPPSRGERQQPEEIDPFEVYAATVESIWSQYRGGTLGPKDAEAVRELFETGVDVDTLERVIREHVRGNGRPVDAEGRPVRTLRWFRGPALDRQARIVRMQAPPVPEAEPILIGDRLESLAEAAPADLAAAIRALPAEDLGETEELLSDLDSRMLTAAEKALEDETGRRISRRVGEAMANVRQRLGNQVPAEVTASLRDRILRSELGLPVLSLFSVDAARDPPGETGGPEP